ncbi:MAG: flagellar basal body-associated FliL family protein [Desulfobacula sp.]|nr:flagellar basal body-associated FliL family protein [Desulfobacula sp.]
MKRVAYCFRLFFIAAFLVSFAAACKEKEISIDELAVGNWVQSKNSAYILWVTNPKGEWQSSVKIPDVTGKIVKSRGEAKGTWHIQEGQMIITVMESTVEKVWEKNATSFFDIIELTKTTMQLKEETGSIAVWNKTNTQKTKASESLNTMIAMEPIAVNLNKNRSHDKNRYLCLDMSLVLQEMMPEQNIPAVHPRAREAIIMFLSSLVFDDVKDFKSIKKQNKKIVAVLNPYMDGSIKNIKIENIIVSTDIDQVEEFLIEHSIADETPAQGDEKKEE